MRVGSLFAGIGGIPLAAQRAGFTPAWVAEIEPYASAVLAQNFPGVPNHGDVKKVQGSLVGPTDILSGGFPCQDISLAGKGAGIEGERSGLWKEFYRLIFETYQFQGLRYALIENVAALRSRGLDVVLRDLMAIGFDAEWHCIPATYVGAPHRRDRIWIVAWPSDDRPAGWLTEHGLSDAHGRGLEKFAQSDGGAETGRQGTLGHDALRLRDPVADAERAGLEGHAGHGKERRFALPAGSAATARLRSGEHAGGWWAAEPHVGRVADGIPARVDRLKGLGNSCVPQIPTLIFQAIASYEASR